MAVKYVQHGTTIQFGIAEDELSLITQNVTANWTSDKAEVRDKQGEVVTVTYYNKRAEVTIDGYGDGSADVATAMTMLNTFTAALDGALLIDSCQVTLANEDHIRSSVSATLYPNISPTPTP